MYKPKTHEYSIILYTLYLKGQVNTTTQQTTAICIRFTRIMSLTEKEIRVDVYLK